DIGQCWPAGLPLIMTRVWPVAMIQLPTAIYMVSHFMNSLRIVYLDGRPHSDPDVVVRTFNGESIGKWEGDTLVVDTTHFVNDHHWIDAGIPATDALHIVERMRLLKGGAVLEIEYTLTDPKSWEGEMKWTKRWNRVDDQEVTEVECTPDLNSHIPSTQSDFQARYCLVSPRLGDTRRHHEIVTHWLGVRGAAARRERGLGPSLGCRHRSRENGGTGRHRQAVRVDQSALVDGS